jgi:tetratricopeptide (TPR) repeat protein
MVLAAGNPAAADQIVVKGLNYPSAKVLGMDGGRLRFRVGGGRIQEAWIDEVELLVVDRGGAFVDFNQAEQFMAGGEPERAIARYRRMLRLADELWSDVTAARLVRACNAANRLDDATVQFVRVLRGKTTGPPAAARLLPDAIPSARDGKVTRAVEQLDSALALHPPEPERVLLLALRYEIHRRIGDERSAEAERLGTTAIPAAARSERVYAIQAHALRETLEQGTTQAALTGLDEAIRDGPESALPALLLLKGRALLSQATSPEEAMRAAWAFLRVAVHFPNDERASEALLGAAASAERYGRQDQAIELLSECVAGSAATPPVRQAAEETLRRLQGAGP